MNGKEIRVLLIEDNPGDIRLIQEMLIDVNSVAFDLICTDRLSEGLKLINDGGIDIVLLDLSLPDSSGLETFNDLITRALGIPIIVLTGLDDEEIALKAVKAGAQDYLVKGHVDSNLLVRSIRYAIERKQAEEALRENERRYRLLAENVTDVIWTVDMDLRYTYISPSVTRLQGHSVEEAMALSIEEVLTPASMEIALKTLAEELAIEESGQKDPRRSRTLEFEQYCKDGHTIWTEATMTFLRDQYGQPIGILGITRDITERKRAEKMLKKSEERYRMLSEELKKESSQLSLLYNYSIALRNASSIQNIVKVLNDTVTELKAFNHVFLTLLDSDGTYLVGIDAGKKSRLRNKIEKLVGFRVSDLRIPVTEDNVFAKVIKSGKTCIETDRRKNVQNLCDLTGMEEKMMSMVVEMGRINTGISLPIIAWEGENEKKILGVLGISSSETKLNKSEIELLESIANHTGLAIHRLQTISELRHSEEKYRQLVENANESILVIQDGMLKFANPQSTKLTGYSIGELTSRPFIEFVFTEDRKIVAERYMRRLKGEYVPHTYSFRIVDKAGDVKWVEINAVTIEWEGKPATLNFLNDITDRTHTEMKLKESELRFKQVAENAQEWIWEVDANGLYTYASPIVEKMLGYKPEEIVGKKYFYDLFHPEDKEEIKKAAFEAFARKEPFHGFLNRNVHKNGKTVWLLTSGVPVIDEKGGLVSYRGADIDITEAKHAQEELKSSEERLRILFEYAPDAIYILDLEGNFVDGNMAAEALIGYRREEVIGRNMLDLNLLSLDQVEKVSKLLTENAEGIPTGPNELILKRKDGKKVTVEIRTYPVKIEYQDFIMCMARDITKRKRAEEELIKSEKLAGIGTLASGIAHEINNPLAGIIGYAEIIKDECNPENSMEYADKIILQANRAADIVKWLSRYSKDAKDSKITEVDVCEVIDDSLEALKHTRKSFDIDIVKEYRTVPKIMGNRSELQQVFVNLLSNAVDAINENGRIRFSTMEDDDSVKVMVFDNGKGIPKANMNKIFDPFFTTKAVGKGTGLGLYVTSMIVKKHHGAIEVDSEIGKGTTFTVKFPIS